MLDRVLTPVAGIASALAEIARRNAACTPSPELDPESWMLDAPTAATTSPRQEGADA